MQTDANFEIEFIECLQKEFEVRKIKNRYYSLRAFARDLCLEVSCLSELFSRKRRLTKKIICKVASRIELEKLSPELTLTRALNYQQPAPAFHPLDEDKYKLASDWSYFALASLVSATGFKNDPHWIARRLSISVAKVKKVLKDLVWFGILEKTESSYKPALRNVSIQTKTPDFLIQKSHFDTLRLAETKLIQTELDLRDFSHITFNLSPENIGHLKQEIMKFRKKINRFSERQKSASEVYRLAIQLYPLTIK